LIEKIIGNITAILMQYPALLWEEELDAQKKPESSEASKLKSVFNFQ